MHIELLCPNNYNYNCFICIILLQKYVLHYKKYIIYIAELTVRIPDYSFAAGKKKEE